MFLIDLNINKSHILYTFCYIIPICIFNSAIIWNYQIFCSDKGNVFRGLYGCLFSKCLEIIDYVDIYCVSKRHNNIIWLCLVILLYSYINRVLWLIMNTIDFHPASINTSSEFSVMVTKPHKHILCILFKLKRKIFKNKLSYMC